MIYRIHFLKPSFTKTVLTFNVVLLQYRIIFMSNCRFFFLYPVICLYAYFSGCLIFYLLFCLFPYLSFASLLWTGCAFYLNHHYTVFIQKERMGLGKYEDFHFVTDGILLVIFFFSYFFLFYCSLSLFIFIIILLFSLSIFFDRLSFRLKPEEIN